MPLAYPLMDRLESRCLLAGAVLDYPAVFFGPGSATFDAAAGVLHVEATARELQLLELLPPAALEGDARLVLTLRLGADGQLLDGGVGSSLVVSGEVAGDPDLAGVLLTARPYAFVWTDGPDADYYEVAMEVTGGLLADLGWTPAQPLLWTEMQMRLASPASTFTGTFAQDFSGGAEGIVEVLGFGVADPWLSGSVFEDANNNGRQDAGEAGIPDVVLGLFDASGTFLIQYLVTDADGRFFARLGAGSYQLVQYQPATHLDGLDSGQRGALANPDGRNDVFLITLSRDEWIAVADFAELPTVSPAQTGSVEFWASSDGQALLISLNDGWRSRELGRWMARSFPAMYGHKARNMNLALKTSRHIGRIFAGLAANPDTRLEAQVMAMAFNLYVADARLAGHTASAWGFEVSSGGAGARYVDVGTAGRAFGVPDGTVMTLSRCMKAVNGASARGVLYAGDPVAAPLALEFFTNLNQR